MEDVRNAWLFAAGQQSLKLKTIIYQGRLAYRNEEIASYKAEITRQ